MGFPYCMKLSFPMKYFRNVLHIGVFLKESVFYQCIPSKFLKQKGFSRIEFVNEILLKCVKRRVFLGKLSFSMKYIRNVLNIKVFPKERLILSLHFLKIVET